MNKNTDILLPAPQNTETGFLKARVFTAGGAIPVGGATVHVFSCEDDGENVDTVLYTDRNGETEEIELPTPSENVGNAPGNLRPFAVYGIEAIADGFYPFEAPEVAVFDGVLSVQPIALIPKAEINPDTVVPENAESDEDENESEE